MHFWGSSFSDLKNYLGSFEATYLILYYTHLQGNIKVYFDKQLTRDLQGLFVYKIPDSRNFRGVPRTLINFSLNKKYHPIQLFQSIITFQNKMAIYQLLCMWYFFCTRSTNWNMIWNKECCFMIRKCWDSAISLVRSLEYLTATLHRKIIKI